MLWPLILFLTIYIFLELRHKKTAYYQVTHIPYFQMRWDLGRYGEYLTYQYLRHYEKEGAKFLFNLYIPKGEHGTTEIDVLMITPKGLFVFESKNYSGWIFGSEHQPKWYQTLPQGRGRSHKEAFYNPIMQNRTHIKNLKALLGESTPMHAIITFSERCTLKNVQVTSPDIYVINRGNVARVAAMISSTTSASLPESQIQVLYDRLYPYTQADAAVKERHIAEINQSLPFTPNKPVETHAPTPPAKNDPIEQKLTPPYCPRCGGALVLRTAKNGSNAGNQFYGCSNFPKCHYIQNL